MVNVPSRSYSINLKIPDKSIRWGHLKLGGQNPQGDVISVNSYYISLNGVPFIPISGEFQPTRYPQAFWEEELIKMKAGGINIIAFYIFWIHHEEEGFFDWNGDKNIRLFVELIAKNGLYAIPRIGPFVHGECRNGGLPDWLYGQPWEVRSNHPGYLQKVERYYNQIGAQLKGLFFQDGGPIIGLQLDNEYESSGAPWDAADRSQSLEWLPLGKDGVSHIRHLQRLAEGAGLHAPLLTLTGWGSPIMEGESLPVQGGYAYPVWVQDPGPSDLYVFKDFHNQPAFQQGLRYNPAEYPAANAEMQGGIQVRINNRPIVLPRSTEALALVRLGGGANLLGYYVYHGGSNPRLKNSFPNEIYHPQVSYDFQAVIGEYGEVRDACRFLKTINYLAQSLGEELAPMGVVLPAEASNLSPLKTDTLRWCVRTREGRGFVFLNNFQDHLQMPAQENFRLELQLPGETITIPARDSLTLPADTCCILPFNMSLGGVLLQSATVQPFTVLHILEEIHYFFFVPQGFPAQYCFDPGTFTHLAGDTGPLEMVNGSLVFEVQPGIEQAFTLHSLQGKAIRVSTLTRWQAEHAWRGIRAEQECMVISPADVTFPQGKIRLAITGKHQTEAWIFPAFETQLVSKSTWNAQTTKGWTYLQLSQPDYRPDLHIQDLGSYKWLLQFPTDFIDNHPDAFLTIDYSGDSGAAFIDGRLVADNYNNGTPWVIGLKRFMSEVAEKGLVLKFRPFRKGSMKIISNEMAGKLQFEGEEFLDVKNIKLSMEYHWELSR